MLVSSQKPALEDRSYGGGGAQDSDSSAFHHINRNYRPNTNANPESDKNSLKLAPLEKKSSPEAEPSAGGGEMSEGEEVKKETAFSGLDTLTYVASSLDRTKDAAPGATTTTASTPAPAPATATETKLPSLMVRNSLGGVLPPPVPQGQSGPSPSGPMSISSLTTTQPEPAPAQPAPVQQYGAAYGWGQYPAQLQSYQHQPNVAMVPVQQQQQQQSQPLPSASGRKKKQCSICHGWFSNLATHKSIHLSDNSRPHSCEVCGRGFARPNDLFRHQKSHRGDAPFRCPLYTRTGTIGGPPPGAGGGGGGTNAPTTGPDGYSSYTGLEPTCHQNGGFSRCDTYKNHLKAMHFEYPAGTKKRERNGMGGKCKGCGHIFTSTEAWITDHIETGACEGVQRVKQMNESSGASSTSPTPIPPPY